MVDFKTLYSNNASPMGMVYFLSVFNKESLSITDVKQVLSVKKVLGVCTDADGNLDNRPGYQPTEKTFTIVLKAIETVSYDWQLTKDFMDVICKTLDFKTLNDKLKFNDISKIDNEVLEEINCFYGVIDEMIIHNRLDKKNGEQALEENDFYAIFNMKETKGTLINFWKKINGASQDPKDNSFYKLLKMDVINKLAENEKNTHAVQLKKLVGNGNILKSLDVEIEDTTTEINKINQVENKIQDTDKFAQLGLTQTKNENKILIWKNLILILLIGLAALASLIFGINIKFLFITFITNPLIFCATLSPNPSIVYNGGNNPFSVTINFSASDLYKSISTKFNPRSYISLYYLYYLKTVLSIDRFVCIDSDKYNAHLVKFVLFAIYDW